MAAQRITSSGAIRITSDGAERITSTIEASTVGPITLSRDVRRPFADLRLALSEDGADLVLEHGDLAVDEGLVTASLVSLFSDARAPADLQLPAGASRRGFWGEDSADPFGSLLWLLEREKITAATLERMRTYAARALQWLVDEGIAERVEVTVERGGTYQMNLAISLRRGAARRWERLWAGTDADPLFISGLRVQILTS